KREVGADAFLKANPTWDGRGVVIAVWDTGVDPAAAGLAVTTTGERKIVDILDASGSGDVVTTTQRKPDADGQLLGLSGRKLTLPEGIKNPAGDYRLGLKPASELFYTEVLKRLNDRRAQARAAVLSRTQAERAALPEAAALKAIRAKAPADRTRAERDVAARAAALDALEDPKAMIDPGALYDCVLWQDGTDWRVVIDTDEDGDLRDEKVLRPFAGLRRRRSAVGRHGGRRARHARRFDRGGALAQGPGPRRHRARCTDSLDQDRRYPCGRELLQHQ
ncbi:MAG: hypothetical protein NTZ29_16920, partial [Verrucomicrobia bacterium]|nr:hypothetical protein [Verrucomicrobiota bacterium]